MTTRIFFPKEQRSRESAGKLTNREGPVLSRKHVSFLHLCYRYALRARSSSYSSIVSTIVDLS